MSEYTTETIRQIWSNFGYRIEIGPDADGLGVIEIRYIEKDGEQPIGRITMDGDLAKLVAKVLTEYVAELERV
jgi:hypothetical protein